MKTIHTAVIALFGCAALSASVTNVTPGSEENSPPSGTQNFSDTRVVANPSPLAELLERGRGVIEFSYSVTYIAEEVDAKKDAEDGSKFVSVERARTSFPFESGRFRALDKSVEKSATRIFASSDGFLVIQRGHFIRMIPVASIKSIQGYIPDQPVQKEQAPSEKE